MPAILRGYYYKNQSLPVRGFPYREKVLKNHRQGTETLVSIERNPKKEKLTVGSKKRKAAHG
jgi:hypothetical protein